MKDLPWHRYFPGDGKIWTIVGVLSAISILVVYNSTGMLAYRYQGGHTAYYVLKHTGMVLSGMLIMFIVSHIKYTYFSRIGQVLFLLAVPLLALTLAMPKVNDASRWLEIPLIGVSFQTSDLAKLALIMYLARILAKKQPVIGEKATFYQVVWPPLLVCALIFPENLSTAVLLMTTSLCMMFFGGVKVRYLMGLMGVFVLGAGLLLATFYIVPKEHLPGRFATWKARIENFASDDIDSDSNYQATQAKIAVANGGLVGQWGNGTLRNFLPHPYSDYAYAMILEEGGM
ncbi:MAG: FtsW/RodA/SpoVE family cell cycle protein, partial [Bacteroidales bacterium]|nr:FtsW/RodA/SpoVE family cell cycle protein [Bacteroidales bacterium]